METDVIVRPWYREPWPWLILGILSLGPIFGLGILTVSLNNPPQIVGGDHAPLGKAVIDTNQRTAMARSMGLSGQLRIDGDDIRIDLRANHPEDLPESLLVQFVHPANSDGDTTAVVRRNGAVGYMGRLAAEPNGRSRIVVSDLSQTWWLGGRMRPEADAPDDIRLSAQRL